jgi:hypothetical protein
MSTDANVLYIRPTNDNTHKKKTQICTPKKGNNARRQKDLCSQTNVFNVNNDNVIVLKYIDLRSSAVRRFSKSK